MQEVCFSGLEWLRKSKNWLIAVNCVKNYDLEITETLKQHDDGEQPWEKITTDLFEIKGHSYLVTIDYYSNFMEVDNVSSTTSNQVFALIKKQCAHYGIPKCIVSDPGPQLTSKEFRLFTSEWGINHVMSSPGHHSVNGKAEAVVKVMKHMMIKVHRYSFSWPTKSRPLK